MTYQSFSDENDKNDGWVIINTKYSEIIKKIDIKKSPDNNSNESKFYLLIINIFSCCGFFNLLYDKKLTL